MGNGEPAGIMPSPQNVTATVVNGTIRVEWEYDSESNNIAGFKLKRQYNFGDWGKPVGGTLANPDTRSFSDGANLLDGIYAYRVFAYLLSNNYPFSETVVAEVSNGFQAQLDIIPTNRNISNASGSTIFDISFNVSWSVSDDADWINVSPESGSNDDTLKVSYDSNGSLSERIGSITVSGGGITRTVTISQAAMSQLKVIPENQDVGNTADSIFFEVISNISWTITDDSDWLTVAPMSGSNNDTLIVYFDANDLDSLRESTITITGEDIIRTVTISQDGLVGINELEVLNEIPKDYTLFNNYPNPFNPSTIIEFSIPEESNSMLKIYDILGNEIAVFLKNEVIPAGRYRYEFKASNIPSGIYLYVLSAESTISKRSFRSINKMILLK